MPNLDILLPPDAMWQGGDSLGDSQPGGAKQPQLHLGEIVIASHLNGSGTPLSELEPAGFFSGNPCGGTVITIYPHPGNCP